MFLKLLFQDIECPQVKLLFFTYKFSVPELLCSLFFARSCPHVHMDSHLNENEIHL